MACLHDGINPLPEPVLNGILCHSPKAIQRKCSIYQYKMSYTVNIKHHDDVYGKVKYKSTWQKWKYYLRRENKVNKKQAIMISWDIIKTYVYICKEKREIKTMKKCLSFMSNLQTNCGLKLDFQKSVPTYRGPVVNPVRYPSWEYKFDIKGYDGNISNPIF